MNLGVPEVLIILMMLAIPFVLLTVYAAVRASRNGDGEWVVGIVVGWVLGAGWLVGLIYLLTHPATAGSGASGRGSSPTPLGPTAPAGWQTDPTGRFEQRYWDGTRWTEHVTSSGDQTLDPV